MAVGDENIIEHDVVKISPDLTGFKEKLQADLKKAVKGVSATVKIKLVADATGFNKSAKEALAKQSALKSAPTYKVKLVADARGFNRSAKEALRGVHDTTSTVKVRTELDKASVGKAANEAENEWKALGRRFSLDLGGQRATQANIKEQARKDEAFAEFHRANAKVLKDIDDKYARDSISVHHETASQIEKIDKSLAGARIQAQTAVERAFTSAEQRMRKESKQTASSAKSDGQSTKGVLDSLDFPKLLNFGGEGLRPWNALIAAGVALSPVLVGIASNAVSAGSSIAAMGGAAAGAGLAIGGLAIAFSGVSDLFKAYTAYDNETTQAAANAANSAKTQAHGYNQLQDSLLGVSNARDTLAAAQKAEKDAQEGVNKARVKAKKDIDALRQSILDLRNAEKGDALSIAEARQKAASTAVNFFATNLEKARANQDVRDAVTQLSDDRFELAKKQAELAKATAQGVDGSDDVKAAKSNADAAAAARLRAARAQHSLNRQLKNLNQVQAGQSMSVSSAQAMLNEQMRRASPAAKDMLKWYKENKEELRRLARVIQQGVLPGFTTFLREVTRVPKGQKQSTLQLLADGAAKLGGIIGNTAGKLGAWTNSPFFRKAFGVIQAENASDLQKLANAALALLDPITRIVVASAPLAGKLADGIGKFATWFAAVIKTADDKGRLADWFKKAGQRFQVWLDIGKNLLDILKGLFTSSLSTGDSLVTRFDKFTKSVADWVNNPAGQKKIKDFFDFFKKLDYGQIVKSAAAVAEIFIAGRAFMIAANAGPLKVLLSLFTAWASHNPEQASKFMGNIAGFITTIATHKPILDTLLGVFVAAKLGKVLSFAMKIPILDTLKTALVSKFGVLDKFLGGGAKAATMTVHAGVVNITGKGKGATGGVADALESLTVHIDKTAFGETFINPLYVTFGEPGKVKVPVEITNPTKGGGLGVDVLNIAPKVAIAIAAAFGIKQPEKEKPKPKAPAKTYNFPIPKEKPNYNVPIPAPVYQHYTPPRTGFTYGNSNGTPTQNPQGDADRSGGIGGFIRGLKDAVVPKWLQPWIGGGSGAPATPGKLPVPELPVPVAALQSAAGLFTGLGDAIQYTLGGFGDLATALGDMNGDLVSNQGQVVTTKNQFIDLKHTGIDPVTGKKIITLGLAGQVPVFDALRQAQDIQRSLQTGSTVAAAHQQVQADIDATRQGVYRAAGGPIMGPGTATSDSIPAWLSNGEHVWTAKEVQNVGGQDAMYRMRAAARAGAYRFANGGGVAWPFPINVGNTLIPPGLGGIGTVSGDQAVAAIAEATARAMRATDKQLIALIEAGLVESGLHNLKYGDRDSLGFLQQRAGWGSAKQRLNVAEATRKFIEKAKGLDNSGLTAGQLAQAVQVSAYPGRYDKRYADAVAVLNSAAPYVLGGTGGFGSIVGGRGWAWEEAVLRKAFGKGVQFYSTTGGKHVDGSWHYKGRAVDLTPSMTIFDWIKSHYGANTLELIYGPAGIGIKNGRPYNYGAALNAQHQNHIHWAYANGGAVRQRTYDSGGALPPGYTLAFNGTGKTETVVTAEQQQRGLTPIGGGGGPIRLDRRDMAVLASHIVTALTGQSILMDGRKVAETVRSYDYLPRGI